jgi:hypothetical protein
MYSWEIELLDHSIHRQYDENGIEKSSKELPADQVCRVTLVPALSVLPTHNVFIDFTKGERFMKRFGRGYLKSGEDGIKLREYVQVVHTNKYRFHVFSSGNTILTEPNYELYI